MDPLPAFGEFYLSLVAYFVLHMIFVISSDFVDAFNIPPLNIGIYVDKLAAIRALLMVIADMLEWGILQKVVGDYSMSTSLTEVGSDQIMKGQGSRRIGSLLSFVVMLGCRIVYLWIVYKSDNKSLPVFIVLCIEGFWFGVFQMSFFAIGPEYNALTSLGIHTMGNFIFFFQLILNKIAKTRPQINSLYRVRVHGWICLMTSVIALIVWIVFCVWVTAEDGVDAPSEWPDKTDVWSPFLLFIVGAFAEDFAVPGILPFALLDTDKAALVNYLTPVFFMTGAILTVLANDIFAGWKGLGTGAPNCRFKDWSGSTASGNEGGLGWHGLWAMNLPKYIAFLLAMFCIHGTYGRLRCIVQCRWRVMLLTMFIVIPRAWLETAGYVGVANYAIGRSDVLLGGLPQELKWKGFLQAATKYSDAAAVVTKLTEDEAKAELAKYIKVTLGATGEVTSVSEDTALGKNLKVTCGGTGTSTTPVHEDSLNQKNVVLTIVETGGKLESALQINGEVVANAIVKWLKWAENSVVPDANDIGTLMYVLDKETVKKALASVIWIEWGAKVANPVADITVTKDTASGQKLKVTCGGQSGESGSAVHNDTSSIGNKNVVLTIRETGGKLESALKSGGEVVANKIHRRLERAAANADQAFRDFDAFGYIAYHDIVAMFCRFVYGKFAIKYNSIKFVLHLLIKF